MAEIDLDSIKVSSSLPLNIKEVRELLQSLESMLSLLL
jgi:hypothetical protein